MGCDIYNYTVLKIQHTENNVTLGEIIAPGNFLYISLLSKPITGGWNG